MSLPEGVTLIQTEAGQQIDYRGPRAWESRRITIDRAWDVLLDGEKIGTIEYTMITREQRTPGKRYVNKRWRSPGWRTHRAGEGAYRHESDTKARGIQRLVNAARKDNA